MLTILKWDGPLHYVHTVVSNWDEAFANTQVGDIVFEEKTHLYYKRRGGSFVSTVSYSQ